jgi:hypothetical protein
MVNYHKMLQNHLKSNNSEACQATRGDNAVLAINRLQEVGLDGQQASLWVISRVLDGQDPLEELQSVLHPRN